MIRRASERARRLLTLALPACLPFCFAGSLSAQLRPPDPAPVGQGASAANADSFRLSVSNSPNTCVLALKSDDPTKTQPLVLPYGCRKAFPVLQRAEHWRGARGAIELLGANDQVLLRFTQKDRRLTTDIRDEAVYALAPVNEDWFERQAGIGSSIGTSNASPVRAPAGIVTEFKALLGRYEVVRPGARPPQDCTIDLTGEPRALSGRPGLVAHRAGAVEGCADRGIRIFDPAGWRLEAGRLILIARKGHELALVKSGAGWKKERPSGEPLELRKR